MYPWEGQYDIDQPEHSSASFVTLLDSQCGHMSIAYIRVWQTSFISLSFVAGSGGLDIVMACYDSNSGFWASPRSREGSTESVVRVIFQTTRPLRYELWAELSATRLPYSFENATAMDTDARVTLSGPSGAIVDEHKPFGRATVENGGYFIPGLHSIDIRAWAFGDGWASEYEPFADSSAFSIFEFNILPIVTDMEKNGAVHITDYEYIARCLGGPEQVEPPQGCTPDEFLVANLDGDGDVDLRDHETFALLFGT